MDFFKPEQPKPSGPKPQKNPLLRKALFKTLRIKRIQHFYRTRLSGQKGFPFVEALLDGLNIQYTISPEDLKKLPQNGPFILVSNHPFIWMDGVIMIHLMTPRHTGFKLLSHDFENGGLPLRDFFIDLAPADPNDSDACFQRALHHINQGAPIGIFPAGKSSGIQGFWGKNKDKPWDPDSIHFIVKSGAMVVPLFFDSRPGRLSPAKEKNHPYLLKIYALTEFFKKQNQNIRLRIGNPIQPADLQAFDTVEKAGNYMRFCVYALGVGGPELRKFFQFGFKQIKKAEPLIEPLPPEKVAAEIQHLHQAGRLLLERSGYQVFVGDSDQMPGIIQELGRLRETTFRQVGEGTNQAMDVDGYDFYYRHLFLWDKNAGCIAGAYRLGFGKEIIDQFGLKGFYISSLFDLDQEIIPILSQTLELGRSFVVKEYQLKPLPLFLLWQGIIEVLRKNRDYQYITGPVSISNDFSALSKELIIAFIRKNHFNHQLAALVKPRHEFKVKTRPVDLDQVLENYSGDFHKLDKLIANIEPGAMKVPVLLKQYIRQNAKIICFNVDPKFNNCLDGLMILNLKDLPEETLKQLKDSDGMNTDDC